MFGLDKEALKILKSLDTPGKIQDFLNALPANFEEDGDSFLSPMEVLRKRVCHCTEGAILAALALRVNGMDPLLVDLEANKNDFDHVITVFQKDGKWGAISKTNHAVLRYREPIYRSIRELVLSYFHEYVDDFGRKNLRSYSLPVNLKRFDKLGWMTSKEEIYYIPEYLSEVKHFPILTSRQIRNLRKADEVELEAWKTVEWKRGQKERTNFIKDKKK